MREGQTRLSRGQPPGLTQRLAASGQSGAPHLSPEAPGATPHPHGPREGMGRGAWQQGGTAAHLGQSPSGRGLGFSKGGRLVGGRGLAARVTSPLLCLQAAAPQPSPHTPVTHTHTRSTPPRIALELGGGQTLSHPFSPKPQPTQPPAAGSSGQQRACLDLSLPSGGVLGSRVCRDRLASTIRRVPGPHPVLSVAGGARGHGQASSLPLRPCRGRGLRPARLPIVPRPPGRLTTPPPLQRRGAGVGREARPVNKLLPSPHPP